MDDRLIYKHRFKSENRKKSKCNVFVMRSKIT